ncbi:hypothetical protein HY382_03005 [Candidatus Curtissbacteria bacterium]|nr:hypothetical protein [Candidatus Curtissbacteria bacterium]
MSEEQITISSLSMDLKRVALAFRNGSDKTAERFREEALKRIEEVKKNKLPVYIQKSILNTKRILFQKNKKDIAEDSLMYSTIFQNYALTSEA